MPIFRVGEEPSKLATEKELVAVPLMEEAVVPPRTRS